MTYACAAHQDDHDEDSEGSEHDDDDDEGNDDDLDDDDDEGMSEEDSEVFSDEDSEDDEVWLSCCTPAFLPSLHLCHIHQILSLTGKHSAER